MARMRLYDFLPSGNGYKVRLALRWLRTQFEYIEIDILKGESRTPAFLAKSPFGQIPVLELDDGTCLRESGAILMYLAEGTPLLPNDRLLRARVLEWIGFEQTHVDGVISRARFRRMYPHVIPTREEEFEAWYAEGREALAVLNAHLADRKFLVDERFTIADIVLFAYTHCAEQGGFDLSHHPAMHAWFGRVRQQPGFLADRTSSLVSGLGDRLTLNASPRRRRAVRRPRAPRKLPFDFVLEELAVLAPWTRPMFGCHAVYVEDKIVFVLRDKGNPKCDDGVWIATTVEHHQTLRAEMPSLRSISVLAGGGVTGWQVLPADAQDFEESVLRACDIVRNRDPRIGKVPTPRSPRKSRGPRKRQESKRRKA